MSLDGSVLAVLETLYEFLDRSPTAIVLLDRHKRVVFANERAATLDARSDAISLCASGIALTRTSDNIRLQGLIGRALSASASPGSSMRALRSSGKLPYGLLVAPVPTRDRTPSSTGGPRPRPAPGG